MIRTLALLFVIICVQFIHLEAFSRVTTLGKLRSFRTGNFAEIGDGSEESTTDAMRKARECAAKGLSPGAGLATADEQSDAAYADLINTTMDQRGIDDLSKEELESLSRGAKMWEKGATTKKNKFGLFGDVKNLFGALAGGAHIEKNKFGET